MASTVFRRERRRLLELIQHCLPSFSNALYAEGLISQDIYEAVGDQGVVECSETLLDSIEANVSSDFAKFVGVLESEQHLQSLAKEIVHYCKWCQLQVSLLPVAGLEYKLMYVSMETLISLHMCNKFMWTPPFLNPKIRHCCTIVPYFQIGVQYGVE